MKNNPKVLRILTVVFAMLITSACTTYTVISDSTPTRWKDGHGLVETKNANTDLSAAIDSNTNKVTTFYVELQNISKQQVTVGPNNFFILGPALNDGPARADDPEAEISNLNSDIQYNKKQSQVTTADAIADVLDTASMISGETPKERRQSEDRVKERENERDEALNRANEMENEKQILETTALLKNTLSPGATLTGLVTFHDSLKAGKFLFVYQNGNVTLTLPFHVVKQ